MRLVAMAIDLKVCLFVCLFVRLDPIISHVPVQELKLSAVRFAVDSKVIPSSNYKRLPLIIVGLHFH